MNTLEYLLASHYLKIPYSCVNSSPVPNPFELKAVQGYLYAVLSAEVSLNIEDDRGSISLFFYLDFSGSHDEGIQATSTGTLYS